MDYILGRDSDSRDSALEDDGGFVALQSFSSSRDDEESVQPTKRKNKTRNRVMATSALDTGATIEATASNDSAKFQTGCANFMSEYFGVNPDNIVVKVLVRIGTVYCILYQVLV